jgi:hypothetical protein
MRQDDPKTRLARYLCAAYLANQLGITIGYALKAHVTETPGPYWLELAGQVQRELLEQQSKLFGGLKPDQKPTPREEIKRDFDDLVSGVQRDNPDFRCCFIVLVRDTELPNDYKGWELILASGMPPDLLNGLLAHLAEIHLELMDPSKTKDGETIQ